MFRAVASLERASQATSVEARLYLRVAPRSRARAIGTRARRGDVSNTNTTQHTQKHKNTKHKTQNTLGSATGRALFFSRDVPSSPFDVYSTRAYASFSMRGDGGIVSPGGVPVPAASGGLVAVVLPLAVLEVGALGLRDAAPKAVGLGRKHEAAAGGAVPVPGAGRGAARAVVVAAAAAGVPAAATAAPAAAAAFVSAAAAVLSRARERREREARRARRARRARQRRKTAI